MFSALTLCVPSRLHKQMWQSPTATESQFFTPKYQFFFILEVGVHIYFQNIKYLFSFPTESTLFGFKAAGELN